MNKKDLINAIAEKVEGCTKKDAELFLNIVVEAITEGVVNEGKVAIAGFGTFSVSERAARKGRNPQTSEEILIPASKAPKFKAAKALKDAVNA